MEKQLQIKLIEGEFSSPQAVEVLFTMIGDKIKFHQNSLLDDKRGFGEHKEHSKNRLKELEASKAKIAQLILEARDRDLPIEIHSIINITLKD